MVDNASDICRQEDHLWDVIGKLPVPVSKLTDTRKQGSITYTTEQITRVFLYMKTRGFSQKEMAKRLKNRTSLLKTLGMDKSPRQQTLSNTWEAYSPGTQRIIDAVANGIRTEALQHDVIAEVLVPTQPPEDDNTDTDNTKREYKRDKAKKTIKLARKYIPPEFNTGRAANRSYSDAEIVDQFARICQNQGSAHSEGEYGWLLEDELTCDGSTFLRAIKKIATPDETDSQLTLDELQDEDGMLKIKLIRDTMMAAFDAVIRKVIDTIRGEQPLSDRRIVAAVDTTHQQFHVYPWEDKKNGIPKPGFPPMVSGYVEDKEYKRGYTYATLTLVGDHAPIPLAIEPVKENSKWEKDDSPSFSKGGIVERLLDRAQKFVDIDELLFDRGFYANDVYATVHDHDIIYTSPIPMYEDDYEIIDGIDTHPDADAAVLHNVPVGIDGKVHHRAEYLYVPTTDEDADGKYAVFTTNRDNVDTYEKIYQIVNHYRRRWDIESQYQSLKSFLPKTSSTDYRVRFCNVVFSTLIYAIWRLTDYMIKAGMGVSIREPPVLTVVFR